MPDSVPLRDLEPDLTLKVVLYYESEALSEPSDSSIAADLLED